MKTAIFGGSFNPVHNGHLKLLENAQREFSFDRIIIIPTNIPPHKTDAEFVSDYDRLAMCSYAFDEFERAVVSDYEIRKGGVSYSYDTISYLKGKYPDDKLYFIMGSDMLLTFDKWYRYEDILPMTAIVCEAREDGKYELLIRKAEKLNSLGGEVYIMKNEPFVVSSSEIREKIRKGEEYSCYLPEGVVEYINGKKLYSE